VLATMVVVCPGGEGGYSRVVGDGGGFGGRGAPAGGNGCAPSLTQIAKPVFKSFK